MDLNLLAMLEAVGRTGSFSGAAADLGIPKSSVSRGIARLEDQLGAQLAFMAVLHTWTQTLLLHPHIHCVVPGGGVQRRWYLQANDN